MATKSTTRAVYVILSAKALKRGQKLMLKRQPRKPPIEHTKSIRAAWRCRDRATAFTKIKRSPELRKTHTYQRVETPV